VRASLRVQFSLTLVVVALLPMLIATLGLAYVVLGQSREALKDEAFAHLDSVRISKTSETAAYIDERERDMVALSNAARTLKHEGISKLHAVNTTKSNELVRLFQTWEADVLDVASDPGVVLGMAGLAHGFGALGRERARALYLNQRDLEDAGDGSAYSAAHWEQHGFFRGYTAIHGYLDAFLIDLDGNVVYTTRKGASFGANLTQAPYQESRLAQLYQHLRRAPLGQIHVADIAPWDDEFAMFIGAPVYSDTTPLGILAYRLPLERIDAIVQERQGMAESAETYLVGRLDGLTGYRSNRVVKSGRLGDPKNDSDADAALSGLSGEAIKFGSTGDLEISVYAPLEIPGLNWAILSTVKVEDALAPTPAGETQDFFAQFRQAYGYYDVFLISVDGYIFYTAVHEDDYLTNILTGPYRDSKLGELVNEILASGQAFEISDFGPYAPSGDVLAAFVAAPVLDPQGQVEMIVAAQISLETINQIMQERTGLGDTGETYLVGPDKLWRSDSHFLDQLGVESTILNPNTPVDTLASRSALAGESGIQIIDDYRGKRVLSSWSPLVIDEPDVTHRQGITWAVIAEMDESEALGAARELARTISLLGLVLPLLVGLLAVALGVLFARRLVGPVLELTESATAIASGNLDVRLPPPRQDEVGVLTVAFGAMVARLRDMLASLQERGEELAERTRELEASQRVTFAASELTSPDKLLGLVVDLVRDQFDLYHVQVYLVDEDEGAAVLRESTGYAGSQLLQAKHHIPLDRTTLVTRAIHTGEIILVNDVSQDPNFMPNPLLPDTRSELVLPFKLRAGIVIGALDAQDRTPGRFTPATVDLFRTMTEQVASLFESSALMESLDAQRETMTILTTQLHTAAEIAGQLGTILDPERLLQEVVTLMQSRFGLYHVHVYVLEAPPSVPPTGGETRGGRLVVSAGSGEVGRILCERGHSISLDVEKSLVARAARQGRTMLVADTTLDSSFMPNPLLPQTRSEMAVPLIAGDKVLGVLDAQDDRPNRFTQTDADTFSTLAGQIAVSMQTAGLFEQVETSARQTQVRLEVSQALAAAQTEDEVLDVIIQKAGIDSQAQVTIMTIDQDAGELAATLCRAEAFDSGLTGQIPLGTRFTASLMPLFQHISPHTSFISPNISLDERADPQTRQLVSQQGTASFAMLPITAGEEWLGILTASTREENFFDERKLHLYQTLADQGATALQAARLRAEVRESEDRFRRLSDATVEGIVIHEKGIIIDANQAFARMFGYDSPAELVGVNFLETIVTPETRADILEKMRAGFEGIYLGMGVKKDDSTFLLETEAKVVSYKGREVRVVAVRDITARKQAEQALRERMSIIESSTDFIGIATPDGKGVYVNPAGLAMIGYTAEEFYDGMSIASVQPDLPREALETAMREGVWTGESTLVHKDGRVIPLSQVITVIKDERGNPQLLTTIGRDISERLRAAETLRQERDKAQRYLDIAGTIIVALDNQGDITLINDKGCRVLGYQEGELLGKNWFDITMPEEIREAVKGVFHQLMAGEIEAVGYYENEVMTRSGELRIVAWHNAVLTDQASNISGILSSGEDITERVRAEQALREREEQFRTVADFTYAWEYWLAPDGNHVYVSPACQRITGYDVDEFMQDPNLLLSIVHPDDRAAFERHFQEFHAEHNAGVGEAEFRVLTRDGRVCWIGHICQSVRGSDGTWLGRRASNRDTTERKQVEEERERFTTQLRTAADLAGRINAILEPDQLMREVVDQLHDRFDLYHVHIYLLDEERRELVLRAGYGEAGQTMLGGGHSIPLDAEKSLVARAARSREIVLENDIRTAPDFMPNPLLPDTRCEAAVPLVAGERVLGVFDVQDDEPGRFTSSEVDVFSTLAGQIATALQNAAFVGEIQETTEKLRQVDRLKNEFMSSMSHELRTPLNSIIGFAEVMLMGISGALPSDVREDVQAIYDNGQNLLTIINDVLDLAKIEAGILTLNLEPIPVASLIEGVRTKNAGLLVGKPIEMLIQVQDDLPPLHADPIRINQILNNLVSNAVKFTKQGTVTLRAFREADWLCLQVQDTGVGISETDMDKVFERFQQVDGSHARRAAGTGLGLPITRQLVELHGGTIEMRSKLKKGSTFTVRLPISR
jgi:methyl-accepting chemotaxis protein